MAYEISVGPDQLTINIGECVLITDTDGQVTQPSERGLFYRDTRLMSEWAIRVNGRPWTLLNSAATEHFACQVVLTNPDLPTDDGVLAKGTISLTLSRMLGLGGMRETLEVRNHNMRPAKLALTISMAYDFADIFDVKSHTLKTRGKTQTSWAAEGGTWETVHTNDHFRRGISIGPAEGAPTPDLRSGALGYTLDIAAQGAWSTELLYRVIERTEVLEASKASFRDRDGSEQAKNGEQWRSQAFRVRTPYQPLQALYEQSVDDLAALRLPIRGTDVNTFVPAAGIPWFAALFGRDSLITAMQTVPVYPDFARGALRVLAKHQASGTDDSRDMQPGKIMHELRHGELAVEGLVPYRPYYGTADATPLYIILLHQTWAFTGDDELIRSYLDTAERCLRWIDEYGDMDGDGFQEYQRRTPDGAENQGWKDSGNSVLYEDGRDVPAPKALCELQGYVYDAWRRMAEMYDAIGLGHKAADMLAKAKAMYERFNATFWDEATQYYAYCLDPAKKKVLSVASNPGHLLWSGIVPPERAQAVVDRLMAKDMWSGWGIRTFSAAHPAYNPHDYQLGAIWPHDNGLIALGLMQYGFRKEAAQVARGLVDAADRFLLNRLPEVFAGTSRDDTPFPVQYLGANVPQAWAAGSVFCLLRSMLGARIDPGAVTIYLDPSLPDWLPELVFENLCVGASRANVRIWRDGETTQAELVAGDGKVKLVIDPAGSQHLCRN